MSRMKTHATTYMSLISLCILGVHPCPHLWTSYICFPRGLGGSAGEAGDELGEDEEGTDKQQQVSNILGSAKLSK